MILVVAGPSGVGKTTFLRRAVDSGRFDSLLPITTRQPRPGEHEGFDYEFTSKDEFRQRIRTQSLTDWDYTLGHYYGYSKDLSRRAEQGDWLAIPVLARMAVRLRQNLPNLYLLFLDGPDDELDERLASRPHSSAELTLRQSMRQEERDHAPLFDRWVKASLSAEGAQALIKETLRE